MIHLDNHTATKPCTAALERWQNPSSDVLPFQELLGGGSKDDFVFTSSGSEAIGHVFWSVFLARCRKEGKTHILVSCIDDAPTMQNCKRLEELGCTIKIVPVNESGRIDVEKLSALISPRTALISIPVAHGLTGVIQPIEEIALIAQEKKVLLHLEGTYAVGKYLFPFCADYLTFSGDRIHSVASSGGVLVKEGAPSVPLILSRPLDMSSYAALFAALSQAHLYLDMMNLEVVRLRNLLESKLSGTALFSDVPRLPNTATILFPRIHQEALLYWMQRKGLFATIGGNYCQHLSRVLEASSIPNSECAISFSLSRMTTEEEIERAIQILLEAAAELRTISEDIVL